MKRRKLGQIILTVAIVMIVASGILTWLGLVDAKDMGGFFVIELILVGVGVFMSKKKRPYLSLNSEYEKRAACRPLFCLLFV